MKKSFIKDYIEVRRQPTVVRLEHLKTDSPEWISQSYFITDEVSNYLRILKKLIETKKGCGFFLIGPYGSGKSHFLAFLSQLLAKNVLHAAPWLDVIPPEVMPISLLNYSADVSLEKILLDSFGLSKSALDRRELWQTWMDSHAQGVLIVIDELSEFLRSKPSPQLFNEDIRFLQFLGEWATAQPLWIFATLQEQIERTGLIEGALFRKIKDRYPHRFLLSPAHIKDILQKHILHRKDNFHQAANSWLKQLQQAFPALNDAKLKLIEDFYPLHPVTLEFLEEIRDLFSQSRGAIEFVLQQVNTEFLQEEFGTLLTPDFIVKHFLDLLEIQPEFSIIGEQLLPYYKKHMSELFTNEVQQKLAWKLLYLLILIHLSPRREKLTVRDATYFLLNKLSNIDPKKNEEIIGGILTQLKEHGAYLTKNGDSFNLNLQDNPQNFERLLHLAQVEMKANLLDVFSTLEPLLKDASFNPFSLISHENQRGNWEKTFIRFFGHQKGLALSLNTCQLLPPKDPTCELNLQIELAWTDSDDDNDDENAGVSKYVIVRPKKILCTQDLISTAALVRLGQQALTPQEKIKVANLLAEQKNIWLQKVHLAYRELEVIFPDGRRERILVSDSIRNTWDWLQFVGDRVFKIYYPAFERFACLLGPLAKDTLKQWLELAFGANSEDDWLTSNAPALHPIREGYLVPMGLIRKHGQVYKVVSNLERHELVEKLERILPHQSQPKLIYEYFAQPIYGLVPDQVHVLLIFLLLQGTLDIEKGNALYREHYRELLLPIDYDKITISRGLPKDLQDELIVIADYFNIDSRHLSSVLTQKIVVQKIRRRAQEAYKIFSDFILSLGGESEQTELLIQKFQKLMAGWSVLLECEDDLLAIEQFCTEIQSAKQFIDLHAEMLEYPKFYQASVKEIERFQFLFSHPCFMAYFESHRESLAADDLSDFQLKSPDIANIEQVKIWLKKSDLVYREYTHWYRGRHYDFWLSIHNKILEPFAVPSFAKSRHLSLKHKVLEREAKWAHIKRTECMGLSALDFLPACRCGYNGEEHLIQNLLIEHESLYKSIIEQLELFFAQSEIRSKISDWFNGEKDKLEKVQVEAITSYLSAKVKIPEIGDVEGFDEFLDGAKVIHKVSSADWIAIYKTKPVWKKAELAAEFQNWLQKQPEYIRFE